MSSICVGAARTCMEKLSKNHVNFNFTLISLLSDRQTSSMVMREAPKNQLDKQKVSLTQNA